MRLLKSKKGLGTEMIGDVVIQLLIGASTIIALYVILWASVRGVQFEKGVLSVDEGLTVDQIYGAKGNALFTYPSIGLNLIYDLIDNSTHLYQKADQVKINYKHVASSNIKTDTIAELSINDTEKVQYSKTNNNIKILKDNKYLKQKEECNVLNPKQIVKDILLMPETKNEEKFLLNNILSISLSSIKGLDTVELSDTISSDNFDVLIQIDTNEDPDSLEIEIPFDSDTSRSLACFISNSLIEVLNENYPALVVPIIPSSDGFFESQPKTKAVVSIKIGDNMLPNPMGPPIRAGVERYI